MHSYCKTCICLQSDSLAGRACQDNVLKGEEEPAFQNFGNMLSDQTQRSYLNDLQHQLPDALKQ